MIAHVAAAAEQRGRVVLQLCSANPSRVAIETAIRIAKAFESEVESIFVEDEGVYACAGFPFAREISLSGRRSGPLSTEAVERQMRHMAAAIGRELDALARLAEVPLRRTVVRDDPVAALARACAERGPWNVVVLGDPTGREAGSAVRRLFEAVAGTTGVVLAGPAARRSAGPTIGVIEDLADLEPMLRAAERLVATGDADAAAGVRSRAGTTGRQRGDGQEEPRVTLLLVGESADKAMWMEDQSRLALGDAALPLMTRAVVAGGGEAVLAEVLRRMRGGLVIARFGGLLAPADGDMRHLVSNLECPLFLMR